MQEILSLLIVAGTFGWAVWFASRHGAEPGYDWPAAVYRVRLWWAARRRPGPTITYRAALGRIPGETETQWAQRRDAAVR